MADKKMTLVERLRNPAWESAEGPTRRLPAVLSVEQTRSTMTDAANEIESLQEALDDALNPRGS